MYFISLSFYNVIKKKVSKYNTLVIKFYLIILVNSVVSVLLIYKFVRNNGKLTEVVFNLLKPEYN